MEVSFTADYLDYMAEWARRYEGEIVQSDRRENILVFKRALGVTTGILPWNFPFFLIARKLAPALITGNTIVIKPSEFTPTTPSHLRRLSMTSACRKGCLIWCWAAAKPLVTSWRQMPKWRWSV